MNSEMPTTPSFPVTAISAEAPLCMTYSSEMMAVVGKYTCVSRPPGSYRIHPRGMSTGSRSGAQRCQSASGNAARR